MLGRGKVAVDNDNDNDNDGDDGDGDIAYDEFVDRYKDADVRDRGHNEDPLDYYLVIFVLDSNSFTPFIIVQYLIQY